MEKVVLLADAELMVRKGLTSLFSEQFGITCIDNVPDCNLVMSRLKNKAYSHLIIETVLSDGPTIGILHSIRALFPKLQILVFSIYDEVYIRGTLLDLDIYHYVSKKTSDEDQVLQFSRFFNNDLSPLAINRMKKNFKESDLTPRELEVYLLSSEGKSTGEIAQDLNIASGTVSTIKRNILNKKNITHWREIKFMSRFQLFNVGELI